jgi:hypothetical protein
MANPFAGTARPLDADGVDSVLASLDTGAPELWAVLTVETAGCGFTNLRQPRILFERHVFSRETGGRFDSADPNISNPVPGGYGPPDTQYERLQRAIALDRTAALKSASWGIAQIMGNNAAAAGFDDAEGMVAAMMESETDQLLAMAQFLQSQSLSDALRRRDWTALARGYNGPNFAINQYDSRLASAYAKYAAGPLPDMQVRTAQLLLTYLGYSPGAVDGLAGGRTDAALQAFLLDKELPPADDIDDGVIAALNGALDEANPSP